MDGRIEREFKLCIPGEPAFAALLARLGGSHVLSVLQVNHFFDTTAFDLRRGLVALRLREEGEEFTLALKGPALAGPELAEPGLADPGLTERPEEELALEEPLAAAILAGRHSPLEPFRTRDLERNTLVRRAIELVAGAPLRRIGAFENERTRVGPLTFPPGSRGPKLVFELDRTTFPGGRVERELELEVPEGVSPPDVQRGLEELFGSLDLPVESAASKAERFFAALDGRRRKDGRAPLA